MVDFLIHLQSLGASAVPHTANIVLRLDILDGYRAVGGSCGYSEVLNSDGLLMLLKLPVTLVSDEGLIVARHLTSSIYQRYRSAMLALVYVSAALAVDPTLALISHVTSICARGVDVLRGKGCTRMRPSCSCSVLRTCLMSLVSWHILTLSGLAAACRISSVARLNDRRTVESPPVDPAGSP